MRDALVFTGMLLAVGVAVAIAGTAAPARAEVKAQTNAEPATAQARPNPVKALASCAGCHGLTASLMKKPGPPLYGLYGSKPIKASIPVAKWDEKNLDKFLWNPTKMDPTSRMGFKLRDPKKRADIIAALKILR